MRMMVLVLVAFGVACQKSPAQHSTTAATTQAPATKPAQNPGPPGAAPPAAPAVKPVAAQLPATIARINGEADDFWTIRSGKQL